MTRSENRTETEAVTGAGAGLPHPTGRRASLCGKAESIGAEVRQGCGGSACQKLRRAAIMFMEVNRK